MPLLNPLAMAMLQQQSLQNVWQLARPESPFSNPSLWAKNNADHAQNDYANYAAFMGDPHFCAALQSEITRQSTATLIGLQRYHATSYKRAADTAPIIWQQGSASLRDYGDAATTDDAPIILCIPSLINRHSIMDLSADHSFVCSLAAQGFRPLLLCWDEPTTAETYYGCADYITKRIAPAIDAARAKYDAPLFALGYCLGGIFALGAAQLRPDDLHGIITLATPWDYYSDDANAISLGADTRRKCERYVRTFAPLPASIVQSVFQLMHPFQSLHKYQRFATLTNKREIEHFMAVEEWLHNGLPLARGIAQECLIDWPQDNTLMQGAVTLNGAALRPKSLHLPALTIVASRDHIVPKNTANALYNTLPCAHKIEPDLGHVGLFASHGAHDKVWQPMIGWLHAQLA